MTCDTKTTGRYAFPCRSTVPNVWRVTTLDARPEVRTGASTVPGIDSPAGSDGSFDRMAEDAAEVARQLAEMPHRRVLRIPEQAVALVEDLGSYGD